MKTILCPASIFVLAWLSVAGTPQVGMAGSVFSAQVGDPGPGVPLVTSASAIAISASAGPIPFGGSVGGPAGTAMSENSEGANASTQLRSYSHVSADFPGINGIGSITAAGPVNSSGDASFVFDDLVVSGAPGPISISINYSIQGFMDAQSTAPGQTFAQGYVHVGASEHSTFSVGGWDLGGMHVFDSPSRFTDNTGIFVGLTGPGTIDLVGTTPTFLVDANVPFTFTMNLSTNAFITAPFGTVPGVAEVTVDISRVGFAVSGPIANLPDGYTLNSDEGGIVDNRRSSAPTAVPEPSSLLLSGFGVLGLLFHSARRKACSITQLARRSEVDWPHFHRAVL